MGFSIACDTSCGTLKTFYGKMGLEILTLQNGIFIHRIYLCSISYSAIKL